MFTFVCVYLYRICASLLNKFERGFGDFPQDWGYVDVREGAHMFWWLHYTVADVPKHTDRPLVIWLQGGPGASSTGYGNFEELGPLDLNLKARDFTWINEVNVLFIDNPVGAGYSYVDANKYLTKDNKQIAKDLVQLMHGFYERLPQFKTVPLHIFCESYGGKMAAEFAYELYLAIMDGKIESNLLSVGLGDAWISPIDSTLSWAPYLLQMGFVDVDGYEKIHKSALRTQQALKDKKYFQATDLWYRTEFVLLEVTHGVDFYNVLFETGFRNTAKMSKRFELNPRKAVYDLNVLRKRTNGIDDILSVEEDEHDDVEEYDADAKLEALMRGAVADVLNIPKNVSWGSQSGAVFDTLAGDFMKPVTDIVELLLNSTTLQVIVYNGQLDLICATPGTVEWVNRLKWAGSKGYLEAPRNGFGVNNVLEGYVRSYGNFSMYWVNRAGHMVPFDNPKAMGHILRQTTNFG
ncbi:unnamed protein product [Diamesa hyperborea]